MIDKVYRMVPTRRGPDGWYTSWTESSLERATVSATAFLAEERVPVMITETELDGTRHRQVTCVGGVTRRLK